MNLKRELLEVARALDQAGVPYALCGGLAVALHGYPRLTRDIDLLVRPEDLNAARSALAGVGFSIEAGIIPFDAGQPHERRVYRVSKAIGAELLTVDMLLLPAFLQEVWQGRETYEVEGLPIQVVSRSGLIAGEPPMKPEEMKARSRGISADMSPQAISERLDILVDLYETAEALRVSRLAGRRPHRLEAAPGDSCSGERPYEGGSAIGRGGG